MILPKRATGLIALVLAFVCFVGLLNSRLNPVVWITMALSRQPEVIIPYTVHVVLFQFKQGTSPITIKEITSKLYALKKSCKHPSTRAPYIKSISGGKDISTEGLQDGFTHAFIMHFDTTTDRDYYVNNDPVHRDFKEAAAIVLEKTQVIDFQDGVFTNSD
ncbi:hypothetical protein BS50DRAFT_572073 [Corynespora cassiicola Philippines]|uniref:Stress-response A/B barrel domain-containing protein n=1 Tax=Corynespora cassiicola Philippines TaxID=1448308 RepID=A0A2T2NTY9_CORCC|nr:hypothetical protein BS50DRAFT_572073 [Corynespora cassiicola Philippines]